MPKVALLLSPLAVQRLKRPGFHAVGGTAGLLLRVSDTGARYWVMRTTVGAKRRDIGIGPYPEIGLAKAREIGAELRLKVRDGIDPVAERQAARASLVQARATAKTFDQAAKEFLATKVAEFDNPKHAAQWQSSLRDYASPVLGKMLVRDIELSHILNVLQPIWTTKTETASRVRGRIESVLAWATVKKYRSGDNPARWKGHLNAVLPKPSKVSKVEHQPALPYERICGFIGDLRTKHGIGAHAVEFAVLTAARSGEVRGARWSEIDLEQALWTIPGDRMKAGKEHWVPLSDDAVQLLKRLPRLNDLVFPAPRGGTLSDATMTKVIKDMHLQSTRAGGQGYADPKLDRVATIHGMRSTFRDWAGETTSYPRETIEHALAHRLKDKSEAAYARGSQFDKRRELMTSWASFCAPTQDSGNVTAIRKRMAKAAPTN